MNMLKRLDIDRCSTVEILEHSAKAAKGKAAFSKIKIILILVALASLGLTIDYFVHQYKNKKLDSYRLLAAESIMVDNGDGSTSTSINSGIQNRDVNLKEVLSNDGKQIMHSYKLKDKETKALNLHYTEKLSWGGEVELVNNADITFEYLINPMEFNFRQLRSGAHYIGIPEKSFEARALLEGKAIVSSKLSAMGKVEQIFDFKKKDLKDEAYNRAEAQIRKDAQVAAEETLSDNEIREKLKAKTREYYSDFFNKYGIRALVTFE